MSRRPRREGEGPTQLPLALPSKARPTPTPEQAARAYIARRARASVVPGRVKLTFTLDMLRELAERISARAIREEKNLEAVVMELLEDGTGYGARKGAH